MQEGFFKYITTQVDAGTGEMMVRKVIELLNLLLTTVWFKFINKDIVFIGRRLPLSVRFEIANNSKIKIEGIILRDNCCIRVRDGAALKVGKGTALNNNCICVSRAEISIGDRVNIGPNSCIFDHDHDYTVDDRLNNYKTGLIEIGDDAWTWIGANVTILRNTKIGKGCVVAAGAVVKGTFPDNVLIGGIPAKEIKKI